MMTYDFLKQLIAQAEAFEQATPDTDNHTVTDFATWISQQSPPTTAMEPDPSKDNQLPVDTEIAVMVSYLYRYARLYSKKALAHTPLTTIDEFSYIIMLLEGPPPTKTELIERNIHEKTTGTEILRRLINAGLIEQFDDPVDKRSKRVKLTESGQSLLMSLWGDMTDVSTLVSGNLTAVEKEQLARLLRKLHLFHNPIFINERELPIADLVERLKSKN
ncbi:MarR family winged helix-turn-helix transcriptional regulator [Fibrella aquatica]|jgi:MarR family transcriptional regulator, lower aerobic nicotinate degradation pathway regulator|uniref:MarR family winged helix-turn-helix transcriptional regulator n=1 Tax=Fibrella aquatica TaxID=3242487 RepID=UPI00351F8354